MYSSTYLKWFRRLLILGAVVAGLTASAAGARLDPGTPPDVSDVAFRLAVAPASDVSRPPDVRDAAGQATPATADVFERYASAHPYGFGVTSSQLVSRPPDVRDAAGRLTTATPDVFERYASAHPYGAGLTSSPVVSTPPDVQDAASALHVTAQGLQADGLRWNGVAHAYMQLEPGQAVVQSTTPEGLRADGLRWQGLARSYQQGATSDPVNRILAQERGLHVDQGSFATAAHIKVADSGGFDWNDYAIGIGSGMGLILLAAGLTMGIRLQRGHRVQSV